MTTAARRREPRSHRSGSVGHYQARRPGGRELLLPAGCLLLIVNMADDEARWYYGPGFAAVRTAPGPCW